MVRRLSSMFYLLVLMAASCISIPAAALMNVKPVTLDDIFNAESTFTVTFNECLGPEDDPKERCWKDGKEYGELNIELIEPAYTFHDDGNSGYGPRGEFTWRERGKAIKLAYNATNYQTCELIDGIYLICGKEIAMRLNKKSCPDMTISSGHIKGIFLDSESGDFCHTLIKADTGEEIDFALCEDEAFEKLGPAGSRVSINYEEKQHWGGYESFPYGGCHRYKEIISGKKIK